MHATNSALNPAETSGTSPPEQALAVPNIHSQPFVYEDKLPRKHHRTIGLHIFDWSVYSLNNVLVFGVSLIATYLTARGGDKHPDGRAVYGSIGTLFHSRGEYVSRFFKKALNMPEAAADMFKIVTFSFVDGSIFAVMVKLLENKRENIAQWIDGHLGTKHPDERVYDAEPKQSWKSVGLGRALTAGIVVPTAVALEKIHINGKNINQHLFYDMGEKLGSWITRKMPNLQTKMGEWKIPELSRLTIFEAVYTTICTFGLFFSSRALARHFDEQKAPPSLAATHLVPLPAATPELPAPAKETDTIQPGSKPSLHITHTQLDGRLHHALMHQL